MRKPRQIISESVKKVLNEAKWIDGNDEPIDGPNYNSSDNQSQNNLPPIDRYHPDYWYYRQEEEPYDPTYDEGYLDDYTVNNDDEFKDDLNDWGIEENKQYNKNRKMKQTIHLKENELKHMIAESVKRALKESEKFDLDYDDNGFITNIPEDVVDWGVKCQQLGSELSRLCGKYRYVNDELYQILTSIEEELNAVNGDLGFYNIASHWAR